MIFLKRLNFLLEKPRTIDASDLVGTYTLDEMPALLDKLQEKIDILEAPEETFDLETEPDLSLDDEEESEDLDSIPDFF